METAEIEKPWYKKWWGVIIVILFWYVALPVFALRYIWFKTSWNKTAKIWSTVGVAVVWLMVFANATSDSEKIKNGQQLAQNESQQKVDQKVVTKPSFDVPALFGKNINEIKTLLGKPQVSTIPTKQELAAYKNQWSYSFKVDESRLDVTYNYKTGVVDHFFISSDAPSARTDKNYLFSIGNVKTDASEYRTKAVDEINNPGHYTGVIVVPPKTVQARIADRKKFNEEQGNNAIAARAMADIIKDSNSAGLGLDGFLKLTAPAQAEVDYMNGGEESDYIKNITKAELAAIVDSRAWVNSYDSDKKDLITVMLTRLKLLYPNALPVMGISNGIRTMALGSWNGLTGFKIELKD